MEQSRMSLSVFLSVCLCVLIPDIMLDNLLLNNEDFVRGETEKVKAAL